MPSFSNVIKNNRVASVDWVQVQPQLGKALTEDPKRPGNPEDPGVGESSVRAQEAQLLIKAREEAKRLVDQAFSESEKIRRAGYDSGFQEGLLAGRQQFAAEVAETMNLANRQMGDLMAAASKRLETLTKDYESHLLALAVQVASVFIKSHMTSEQMMAPLREMLHELSEASKINIRMNPEDYEILSASRAYFQEACPESRLMMMEDASLHQGVIHCETDSRIVEFDPGRHIEGLLSEMLSTHHQLQELMVL